VRTFHKECCVVIELQIKNAIFLCLGSQDSTFQHKNQDETIRLLQMRNNLPSEKRFHHPIRETRKELSYMYITLEQQQGLKHKQLKLLLLNYYFSNCYSSKRLSNVKVFTSLKAEKWRNFSFLMPRISERA
jgi:hypothetical protein